MAALTSFKIFSLLTLFTFLSATTTTTITTVNAISTQDLEAVLDLLRAQGHVLFANAISTSDLLFDLLALPSLTLMAPTDPTIFALDMTNTPPSYISTLRLHALPIRLSWSQLRHLRNGSFLPTLIPSRDLRVLRRRQVNTFLVHGGDAGGDGSAVEVVTPGLYYSRDVAVHGLSGILTLRSKIGGSTNLSSSPPVPIIKSTNPSKNRNRTVFFPPVLRINNTSNRNRTVFFPPIPRSNSISNGNLTVFFPPVPRIPKIPPVNNTIRPPPINRTNSSSPPIKSTVRSPFQTPKPPTTPSNRTGVVPLAAVRAQNSSQSPVESHGDTSTGSPRVVVSPSRNSMTSRKMVEVGARGEMCTVG